MSTLEMSVSLKKRTLRLLKIRLYIVFPPFLIFDPCDYAFFIIHRFEVLVLECPKFPVGKKDQWCHAGQETLCPKFPVGKKDQWCYAGQETLCLKFPVGKKDQ